ncbi:MAG: amidase, partial [Mesorhizobium sp.]
METDLVGLAALVAAKDLTPSELAETAQARIDVVNPLINAVIRPIDPAQDLANLADLSATPLSGVPFLIKDLTINYAGLPTSAASPLLIDKPVPHDSELMARYRKSGLITLGKTNTCEFGTLGTTEPKLFGPTRNPWDTTRSSGGS